MIKTRLTDSIAIDGIIMLLGMAILTQFCALLMQGVFSPIGFSAKLMDISQYTAPGSLAKTLLLLLLHYKTLFAPLLGIVLLLGAICLLTLTCRGIVSILMGIGFLLAWMLLWHYPGAWTFEFLFPALFGLCAGFAKLRQRVFSPTVYRQLFLSKTINIIIVLLLAYFLWYVTSIAYDPAALASKIAIAATSIFLVLSFLHLGMDSLIVKKFSAEEKITDSLWVDIITLIVGAMMVMQVYADYFANFYQLSGYTALVKYYSTASGADWIRPYLSWSAAHSLILMPLQIVFEIAIAILLSLLVLRGPVLIASALLFGAFGIIELGISADWPPRPSNLNWEWELLLVTGVSLLIGFSKLGELIRAPNLKKAIFGHKIFGGISIFKRLLISLLSSVLLYFVGIATHIFGQHYFIISLYSMITFFILMLISMVIEKYRCDYTADF